jgi:hypothetical protein
VWSLSMWVLVFDVFQGAEQLSSHCAFSFMACAMGLLYFRTRVGSALQSCQPSARLLMAMRHPLSLSSGRALWVELVSYLRDELSPGFVEIRYWLEYQRPAFA